jgi:hypothetical protein
MNARLSWLLPPLVLLASPALAADEIAFRVVPAAGVRVGGNLEDAASGAARDLQDAASFGLGLEWRAGGVDRWGQAWYSRQASAVQTPDGRFDVTVEYLHIGGTVPIGEDGPLRGYFAAGIGATRFSPSGAGLRDKTDFSGSIGVGASMPVSRRLALRVEARGYLTLVDPDTAFFCRVDNGQGACAVVATGRTLFQAELTFGVAFGF